MALFTSFISAVRGRVVDRVGQLMEQGLEAGKDEARARCPVLTGQTKASIGGIWSRETMTATLYAETPWAYFAELRTPYLRPGMLAMGRVFGGKATANIQFTGLEERYHAGAAERLGNAHRVIIGHRRPRRR